MEHEQDTVLQLQEVIEQLRNVFPSEPGESRASLGKTPSTLSEREAAQWRPEQGRANRQRCGRAGGKIKGQKGGVGIK